MADMVSGDEALIKNGTFTQIGCYALIAALGHNAGCGQLDSGFDPDSLGGISTPLPPSWPRPGAPQSKEFSPISGAPQSEEISPAGAPSPTPRPKPTAPATRSAYLGTIGSDANFNDLVDPRGLAFAGGALFVADAGRRGLLGGYGAVMRFDPTSNHRQAIYSALTATASLPIDIAAVAVSTQSVGGRDLPLYVYPLSPWGVFGFVALNLLPFNWGQPYAPGGVDIAIAADRAWVADHRAVRAYRLPWWLPDESTRDIEVAGVRGIGLDGDGNPWVAAGGRLFRGHEPFAMEGSDLVDPRDVAIDPERGEIVVLEQRQALIYDSAGKFKAKFGQDRIVDGVSLAIGEDGSRYVSDRHNKRVTRYAPL